MRANPSSLEFSWVRRKGPSQKETGTKPIFPSKVELALLDHFQLDLSDMESEARELAEVLLDGMPA